MSEEKEPSAKGFGLRFINAKKTQQVPPPRPDKWSPGVRVITEEEYDRFTNKLALELLATCSPEHLAVIAAQHMIYVDELKAAQGEIIEISNSLKRSGDAAFQLAQLQGQIAEQLRKERVPFGVLVAQHVAAAFQHRSKIPRSEGGKARHKESTAIKPTALKDWDDNRTKYSSRTAFARMNCRKYSITQETLLRWIADYEKAKKQEPAS